MLAAFLQVECLAGFACHFGAGAEGCRVDVAHDEDVGAFGRRLLGGCADACALVPSDLAGHRREGPGEDDDSAVEVPVRVSIGVRVGLIKNGLGARSANDAAGHFSSIHSADGDAYRASKILEIVAVGKAGKPAHDVDDTASVGQGVVVIDRRAAQRFDNVGKAVARQGQ